LRAEIPTSRRVVDGEAIGEIAPARAAGRRRIAWRLRGPMWPPACMVPFDSMRWGVPQLALVLGWAGVVALSACRAILGIEPLGLDAGSDAISDLTDAADAGEGGGSLDASDADAEASVPRRCDAKKPFGTPRLLAVGGTSFTDPRGGRLSADEKHFYFSALSGGGGANIFEQARSSPLGTFPNSPDPITELNNDPAADQRPSLTANLLAVAFDSNRGGGGLAKLYFAMRASADARTDAGTFSVPVPLDDLNSNLERDAYLIGDGRVIYWTSERDSMPARIFRAEGPTPFQYTTVIGPIEVNIRDDAGVYNQAPAVTPDERVIYFAHGPNMPNGRHKIYRAERMPADAAFDEPQLVAGLANPADGEDGGAADFPSWISADDCILYFVSLRATTPGGPAGSSRFWVAERPPP
jgi:hypothetical protein